MDSNSSSSSSPLNHLKTVLQSSCRPFEASQLGDSGQYIVMAKLSVGKIMQMMAVVFQLRREPMRWTKKIPNAWARDTVVKKAPLFLGLVYSPIRTERRGDSMPNDKPHSILPMNIAWKNK